MWVCFGYGTIIEISSNKEEKDISVGSRIMNFKSIFGGNEEVMRAEYERVEKYLETIEAEVLKKCGAKIWNAVEYSLKTLSNRYR